jgi:hypothetical protein
MEVQIMDKEQDLIGPTVCEHCRNETVFEIFTESNMQVSGNKAE